mgnify:CR=1 FL=1
MSKTAMYLIYFCVYSLILLVIGKRSLRFGTSPRDYFISDRRVGTILCVCTFTGTWVSAITILSLTGSVYEDGLAVLLYSVVPWFFGAFLLALVLKRLRQTDAITVPEMFGLRYRSRALQVVYGLITMLVYIFYLVAQYKGFGMVASEVFNIPYPTAVGMVYLFIIYTTFGGYRSVVQTDLFNLCLLFVSLVTLCIALVGKSGGLLSLYEQADQISSLAAVGTTASAYDRTLLSLFGVDLDTVFRLVKDDTEACDGNKADADKRNKYLILNGEAFFHAWPRFLSHAEARKTANADNGTPSTAGCTASVPR